MSFWDIFKEEPKSTEELQNELNALCDRIILESYVSRENADRYESLLKEIYSRGAKPVRLVEPKFKT